MLSYRSILYILKAKEFLFIDLSILSQNTSNPLIINVRLDSEVSVETYTKVLN